MGLKYKVPGREILERLKEKGYSTYKLTTEHMINPGSLQNIRKDRPISWQTLGNMCKILGCQPGDLLEYEDE